MTETPFDAEIREANLTYLMLAQNIIRCDKVEHKRAQRVASHWGIPLRSA